ncbi:hypothetical protein V8F33_001853 [Rhypophila sp. PSN 637]
MSNGEGPPPPPPPFVEPYPGFSNETNGPLIVVVTTALTGLATLFVIARIYSRMISVGKIALDDWIIIISIVLGIWYVGMSGAAVHYGGGRHIMTLKPEDTTQVIKLTVISFVPGVTSFVLPKFGVVILLAKLLNPPRLHIIFMWIISVIYGLMTIAMLSLNFGQCTPAAAQWDMTVKGTCMDRKIVVNYAMTLGIVGAVYDFYLAAYPTFVLWGLQMNIKKKLALCSSLGFGYCAGAVAIYKCTTFQGLLTLQDYTYALGNVVLWTNIEANSVVISACIPLLLPLMKKIFGSSALGGSTGKSGGAVSGNSAKSKSGNGTSGLVTFGAGSSKRSKTLSSHFDGTHDSEDSKYIILEERSFQYSSREAGDEDASVLERVRATRQEGW